MQPTALIAIGGNALMTANETPAAGAERTHVAEVCRTMAGIVADGWRVVITHGNGPQVGAALLRSERTAAEAYPLSLDLCVASTQGEVGYLLQQTLGTELQARGVRHPIVAVVTQVVVDAADPAFATPTKPIGPPRASRRVVPSPEPLEIIEERVIQTLVEGNVIVITLGGGGIPVVRDAGRLTGVEAVVDKDLASALLARRLRVDRLLLVTDVDRVYLDFGTPGARGLDTISADELRGHLRDGQFPAGSMGPKVEAALRFVEGTNGQAVVCSLDALHAALRGQAGTRIAAIAPDARDSQSRGSSWIGSAR
jgi:carbamate kinase